MLAQLLRGITKLIVHCAQSINVLSLQEAQWTTAENLRRKLAWKDHTVDGWTIESYSMQSAIPQAPVDSEGSPPSRLHNANRCALCISV